MKKLLLFILLLITVSCNNYSDIEKQSILSTGNLVLEQANELKDNINNIQENIETRVAEDHFYQAQVKGIVLFLEDYTIELEQGIKEEQYKNINESIQNWNSVKQTANSSITSLKIESNTEN